MTSPMRWRHPAWTRALSSSTSSSSTAGGGPSPKAPPTVPPSAATTVSIDEELTAKAERVTRAGAASNVGLAAAKFGVGFLASSTALIADAVHSLADLVGDAMTLLTVRTSRKPPDEDHPYGHGKVRTEDRLEGAGAISVHRDEGHQGRLCGLRIVS